MRARGWLLVLLVVLGLAWYLDWFAPVRTLLGWMASGPDVRHAFRDPEHGRLDALLMLLSFTLVTPVVLLVAAVVLTFVFIVVALAFEPIVRILRLPSWTSVPMVVVAVGYAAYSFQELWLPQSLRVLGLVARASIVYFSAGTAIAR